MMGDHHLYLLFTFHSFISIAFKLSMYSLLKVSVATFPVLTSTINGITTSFRSNLLSPLSSF